MAAGNTMTNPTPTVQANPSKVRSAPAPQAALDQRRALTTPGAMTNFLRAQGVNSHQHAAALRPFRPDEFGTGAQSPSPAHIQTVNAVILKLRRWLLGHADLVSAAAGSGGGSQNMQRLLIVKERAGNTVTQVEKIWSFYYELFGQRQSSLGRWLLATDRVALDCYQVVYTGLGAARSIPSPPPFTYMATGFTPATFRRGVRVARLGKLGNLFPIVQLPLSRLCNPWTLGAIHHEISHNIQSDLGLWGVVPQRILTRLQQAGLPPSIANVWARWHKEIWADLSGLLLGGPAVVASLIGVVARTPRSTQRFNPRGVHPTPYLRIFISTELLRRMGFERQAETFNQLWNRLYPGHSKGNLPEQLLSTFVKANRLVVDTICFQPYPQLGGKSYAEVVPFKKNYEVMIQEAGQRLAAGIDPGIIPERFLIGAARWALDHDLARPGQITKNFYQALGK